MNDKVSVIIPAYKVKKYIEQCLDSVKNQTHKDIDIFLGIDGCEETREKVSQIYQQYKNLRCFWFPQNVGTYIVVNTLATQQGNQLMCFFGADDVMKPFMVADGVSVLDKYDLVRYRTVSFSDKGGLSSGMVAVGSFLVKGSIFDRMQGFRSFRVGADRDFKIRCELKKIPCKVLNDKDYFSRRRHPQSLTSSSDTGMRSKFRKKCHAEMEKLRLREDIPITTSFCEELFI